MLAVDTSVAVPLLTTAHPQHDAVETWARGRRLALGPRAVLETYAVLTRLPGSSRVSPSDAVALIEDNFDLAHQRPYPASDLPAALAGAQVAGGASYDAVIALEATRADLALASRDVRARATYERVGATVRLLD